MPLRSLERTLFHRVAVSPFRVVLAWIIVVPQDTMLRSRVRYPFEHHRHRYEAFACVADRCLDTLSPCVLCQCVGSNVQVQRCVRVSTLLVACAISGSRCDSGIGIAGVVPPPFPIIISSLNACLGVHPGSPRSHCRTDSQANVDGSLPHPLAEDS